MNYFRVGLLEPKLKGGEPDKKQSIEEGFYLYVGFYHWGRGEEVNYLKICIYFKHRIVDLFQI